MGTTAYIDGNSLALAYTHMAGEKVSLSTEITFSSHPRGYSTIWGAGFQFMLTAAIAKANITSEGKIQGILEHDLSPQTRLTFCADLDHSAAGKHKFGVGLTVHV
jgi:Eukaryotic porin